MDILILDTVFLTCIVHCYELNPSGGVWKIEDAPSQSQPLPSYQLQLASALCRSFGCDDLTSPHAWTPSTGSGGSDSHEAGQDAHEH